MEELGHTILEAERVILLLLVIALFVSIMAKRFRWPYTVGLVLIGLVLTFFTRSDVQVSPELIMGLLVPPLLFEAAFHIRVEDLRRDFWLVMLLAIPGVIITTMLVGGVINWGTGMALPTALIFGALIAATDPVAVVALFKQLGVPKRLQILLEGESLFNDGTAIVMFGIMLDIAMRGQFDLAESIATFLRVAGGGVFVGVILGMLASQAIGRIDDALVETTITTILAFGAYLIAEELHVSGVLAVVAAGIVNGNVGPRGMSPTTRIVVFNFWEYGAFLANSLIFLLIGLTTDVQILIDNWQAIGVAIMAILGARAVGIYGFSLFGRDIPSKWRHVLYWGGLRGAIVLALALSIPESLGAERERILAMAFGVVLFTLLIQGSSMNSLIKKLRLIKRTESQVEYERRHARFVANRSASKYLETMNQQGLLSEHIWRRMASIFEQRDQQLIEAVREALSSDPFVEVEELDTARREALRVQRGALGDLFRDGVISEEVYAELVSEVDEALTEQHVNWSQLLQRGNEAQAPINKMMAVVIQQEDLETTLNTLSMNGFGVDRLPSAGGFLSRRNVTLLIGIPKDMEKSAVEILRSACKKRVEYIRAPLEGAFFPLPKPTPVTVGGATIFTFDIEGYYEF